MVPICQLILASASPRRQNLLRMLGLDFKVMVSTFEEKMDLYSSTPEELVMQMARGKAEEVWKITSARQETSDGLVLGADTIVVMNGEYLGKPDHEEEARKMLTSLAGRWHQVFTGLALVHRKKSVEQAQAQ